MNKYKIGVNLPYGTPFLSLGERLRTISDDGFDACEINLSTFLFIIKGKVESRVTEYVKSVLDKYPLTYTAHIGYGLDLRQFATMEINRQVLLASIDVTAALGIKLLNLHFEEESPAMENELAFLHLHLEAADYAQTKGVALTIENVEIEKTLRVVEFVEKAAHKNLGLTMDFGHMFLSSRYFGYDFNKVLLRGAPLMRHIHINDNTGDFEPLRLLDFPTYKALDRGYRIAYGSGDIHLPPFWGNVPFQEVFSVLKKANYKGLWMCEYYSESFAPFNKEICSRVRAEVEKA